MAHVGFTNTCIVFVVDLDLVMVLYEPRREQMGLRTFANSKASGEPTHPHSLARSFAVCLELYQGLLLVKANSKTSGETAQMRRLT